MSHRLGVVVLGAALALPLVAFGALAWIAERGEVVQLETGPEREATRLWVVDLEDLSFVRGNHQAAWVARVRQESAARLCRGGRLRAVRALRRDDAELAVIAAMRVKYGLSERLRAAVKGNADSVVFLLEERAGGEPEEPC